MISDGVGVVVSIEEGHEFGITAATTTTTPGIGVDRIVVGTTFSCRGLLPIIHQTFNL